MEIWVGLVMLFTLSISNAYTNPTDVAAINNFYVALGSPILPGWVATGGDPCAEAWQGVECDSEKNIKAIKLSAANLGGELGDNLGAFSFLEEIMLSNNHIGGIIPSTLPVSLTKIFLSANKFNGSIPKSLSSLTQLSAMSLDYNQLTGDIPDAFQGLPFLVNLDLSNNNFSGQLPPSLRNSSNLRTLHLQNNLLSGTLDVVKDLHLHDLNVENNQFLGPIPEKLMTIPIFKKDGNLFNTTISPLAPDSPAMRRPPMAPFFRAPVTVRAPPTSVRAPGLQADGPSSKQEPNSKSSKKSASTKRIVWISIAAVLAVIILVLAILLFMPRCFRRNQPTHRVSRRHEIAPYAVEREDPRDNGSLVQPNHHEEKVPRVPVAKPKEEHQPGPRRMSGTPKPRNDQEGHVKKLSAIAKTDDHVTNIRRFDIGFMPPPPPLPPSPPPPLTDTFAANPIAPAEVTAMKSLARALPLTSVKSFSIGSLQQYTNSFSQENLLGGGMLGSVYKAELPDGRLLSVKKLDKRVSSQQKDDEFLELVNNLDKICHANVVELMGYCAEHGQRLLIYEYCSNGTLQDALHSDGNFKENLSWNIRIRMALEAARALEYLHEVCDPPIIHRNLKSANILLDEDLSVYVSDCGLAPLISSGTVSQLSGQLLTTYGYGGPEFESGVYTPKSDVYSFGVVMLELLTGRMSYDRTRTRGEQFLARWAIPHLHDIDALTKMVDPDLGGGRCPVKSLSHFADIISRCVQPEPEFRPPMSEVVQDLIGMIRKESPSRSDAD